MGINPDLIRALAAASNGGKVAEMRVYSELLKSNFLVPIKDPDKNRSTIGVVTIPVRGGKIGIPAFTHTQAVENWQVGWELVAEMTAHEVFTMALGKNFTAVVIDPAGPQFLELRQAELEALVQGNLPLSMEESTAKCIEYFKQGSALILPFIPSNKSKPKDATTSTGLREIQQGIEYLKLGIKFEYRHWHSNWFLGKAFQILGDHEQSCRYFEDAYRTNPNEVDVCRELVHEYLELGRASDALPIANKVVAKIPKDAGLMADLGLVLLMNGQIQEAKKTVKQALAMDRNDQITKNLWNLVEKVERGKTALPKSFSDLK